MIQEIIFFSVSILIKALLTIFLCTQILLFWFFNFSLRLWFKFIYFSRLHSSYKILMKSTNSIIFLYFPNWFFFKILRSEPSVENKRPRGGNSSNHLTVIIAEHHINLWLTEKSHTEQKRQQETLRCGGFFLSTRAACRGKRHVTLKRYIFYATYVFCFHFFSFAWPPRNILS